MLPDRNSSLHPSKAKLLFILSVAACSPAAAAAEAVQIPSGAELSVRLTSPVASAARPKEPVTAVLIAPLLRDGVVLLPSGIQIAGAIKEAHPAAGDKPADIWLEFDELKSRDGFHAPLSARVKEVNDSRETVDSEGRIIGIVASRTLTSETDRGINKLSTKYEGFAGLLQAAKSVLVKPADPEIRYPAGVEMTLSLTKPLSLPAPLNGGPDLLPFPSESGLIEMVADQPVRAYSTDPSRPSDLSNILVVGTEKQLNGAFRAAGWTTADSLDGRSKLETLRAVMEERGYKEGPVSLLTIEGRPPDLVFQKTNNTFAARSHLRIWRRPGAFAGLPIWLATATHDIGIAFSETDGTFTHRIDPDIDAERAKVVNDLLFTELVRSLALVERGRMPANPTNATGDRLITDGRMAVLMLAGAGPGTAP